VIKIKDVIYNYEESRGEELETENRILRESLVQMKSELRRYKKAPLMLCELVSITGDNALIRIPNGNQFLVDVSVECGRLHPGESVFVEQHNLTVVRKAEQARNFNVENFVSLEKPNVAWAEIGGLREQIMEIKEVLELPLKKPEIFEKIGIRPPKGILLHGFPGTGKTLLAKAVATSTNATFIELVASELVQKFIGEGAKLVKDIFSLAREKAPSIVFIDEIDALASKRVDIGTSGEREVQRTFMQLLAEIDGFNNLGETKIVGCTNRKDILDPAIIRPGRLERQIFLPLPDENARREIFRIHTKSMRLSNIEFEQLVKETTGFSGADINAVCTEAGYFAIRNNRTTVENNDFAGAVRKIRGKEEPEEYRNMFG